MLQFKKLNNEPIEIECIEDEHNAELDFESSFWWFNRRYYLKDFIRTHNNAWFNSEVPEYIHGVEMDNYNNPLYIEIIEGEFVNVYEDIEVQK